jgi:hypothetical protein
MCVLIPDTAGTGAHHQSSRGATSRLGRARCPRSRRATYADVCWRMLAYADVCKQTGTRSLPSKQACYVCWRMLTYADVCWRTGTSSLPSKQACYYICLLVQCVYRYYLCMYVCMYIYIYIYIYIHSIYGRLGRPLSRSKQVHYYMCPQIYV